MERKIKKCITYRIISIIMQRFQSYIQLNNTLPQSEETNSHRNH